jgi:hypothetical protein
MLNNIILLGEKPTQSIVNKVNLPSRFIFDYKKNIHGHLFNIYLINIYIVINITITKKKIEIKILS